MAYYYVGLFLDSQFAACKLQVAGCKLQAFLCCRYSAILTHLMDSVHLGATQPNPTDFFLEVLPYS